MAASTCSQRLFLPADLANRRNRIHRVRRSRAHGRAHETRSQPRALVRLDLPRQCLRPHRKVLVHFNQPQILDADARNHRRLLQRRMRLRRSVGHQPPVASLLVADIVRRALARRQQRAQRRARSRILNHSAAGLRRQKFLRQPQHRRPASPSHAFRVRCRPDWSTTASPARPARKKEDRPRIPGPEALQGK